MDQEKLRTYEAIIIIENKKEYPLRVMALNKKQAIKKINTIQESNKQTFIKKIEEIKETKQLKFK